MHFAIIKIEALTTDKEDFATELFEDATLDRYSDYYGEIYSEEERREVIESSWFKDLLSGIAEVDTERETITYLDEDTIKDTFRKYLLDLTEKLRFKAEQGELTGFDFRYAGVEYKENPTMFYENYAMTSFEFAEYAVYRAGETYKIGNIFDAHC